MNFDKFGQYEMTNAQIENTVGGAQYIKTQGNIVRCLTTVPTVNQTLEENLIGWTISNVNLINVSTIIPQPTIKVNLTMP